MKNVFLVTVFILVFGCLGFLGLPWWTLAFIAAAAVFLFPLSGGQAFATGFATGTLLWLTLAILQNAGNGGLLSGRIGQLFMGLTGFQLLMITGFLGGLLAGLGAMTGAYLRVLVYPPKVKRYGQYEQYSQHR